MLTRTQAMIGYSLTLILSLIVCAFVANSLYTGIGSELTIYGIFFGPGGVLLSLYVLWRVKTDPKW